MPECIKCKKEIPDGALYCPWCGKKQSATKKFERKRGNGQGTAYKRGGAWTAQVVIGWKVPQREGGRPIPIKRTKGGFQSKKDALLYIPTLMSAKTGGKKQKTLLSVMLDWQKMYAQRVSAKTMEGYVGAFRHFEKLHYRNIDTITAVDLQNCLDNCGHGKRTKQTMKVTAGLIFKYAKDAKYVSDNPAENLYIGNDETSHYAPLTDEELAKIGQSGLPYSDYVVALSYLGFRPTEFFALKKTDYHTENGIHYLVGGIKTEAGIDRAVTIPPFILPIVEKQLSTDGTDLLFPRKTKGGYDKMPTRYFTKFIWHPMMDSLGIVGKVPYATRHTYANKMKGVTGDEKDKAGLMGHASYDTTRKHYQTTSLAEKKAITDQMK